MQHQINNHDDSLRALGVAPGDLIYVANEGCVVYRLPPGTGFDPHSIVSAIFNSARIVCIVDMITLVIAAYPDARTQPSDQSSNDKVTQGVYVLMSDTGQIYVRLDLPSR